jgi:hypothetical protein
MAQLAQAYIHLRPFYISADRLAELGRATDESARAAALRIYDQQVVIEVDLIEGTLWGKITVTGNVLLAAYTIYSGYPGALDATERLCKKANLFGDYVCSSFIKESGATPEQVARVERRTKTPGKLLRALRRLEHLDKAAATMNKKAIESELHEASAQLNGAIFELSAEEVKFLEHGLKFENLPPLVDWPEKDTHAVEMPKVAIPVKGPKFRLDDSLAENDLADKLPKRRRLQYRNKFTVDAGKKR